MSTESKSAEARLTEVERLMLENSLLKLQVLQGKVQALHGQLAQHQQKHQQLLRQLLQAYDAPDGSQVVLETGEIKPPLSQ